MRARCAGASAFFAGAAGRWDRLRAQLYGEAFTQAALLSLLPPDWVVADLGCGSGHAAVALAPYVGGFLYATLVMIAVAFALAVLFGLLARNAFRELIGDDQP